MTVEEIHFAPSALIQFSASDVSLLEVWARAHYDGACKQAGKPGGFLFGLTHRGPEYRIFLDNGQLQTLIKICEVGILMRSPPAYGLSQQLSSALNEMTIRTPKPITHNQ